MTARNVVVFGGGHGAAAALQGARRYAASVTGVISVADDGGSSGRLRELLDVVAVGDLRRCLLALAAEPNPWEAVFQHRFGAGELNGHAVGNLILAGLIDLHGDLLTGLAAAGDLLGCVGTVLPATSEPVVLAAETHLGCVTGQAAITKAGGITSVRLDPERPRVPDAVLDAIASADQILIGPGSLYTSVLASVIAPAITDALDATAAQVVYLCNLQQQVPESSGYSVAHHVDALARHGITPDFVVCDTSLGMELGSVELEYVDAPLALSNRPMHDPSLLAAIVSPLA